MWRLKVSALGFSVSSGVKWIVCGEVLHINCGRASAVMRITNRGYFVVQYETQIKVDVCTGVSLYDDVMWDSCAQWLGELSARVEVEQTSDELHPCCWRDWRFLELVTMLLLGIFVG